MKVKRYVVDSMPDALQKIRAELGKDAVIINTKEIRVGGLFGLFSKKKVEVVAATDSNSESASPSAAWQAQAKEMKAGTGAVTHRPATGSMPYTPNRAASLSAPASSAGQASVERLEAAADSFAGHIKEALVHDAPSRPQETGESSSQAVHKQREDALLAEMKQMKELMKQITTAQLHSAEAESAAVSLPVPFERYRERLVQQEVRPDLAQLIAEEAAARIASESTDSITDLDARRAVREGLLAILTKEGIEPLRQETRIAHFVGPTGVGKTTTIAKLAAEQVLRHKRNVGFITADTYRIAAVEQLRTYANILNVPLEVVFSAMDMKKAFERLSDRDLIFMDTAGRNYRNEMAVSEVHSMLRSDETRETFLVLSLSMKYIDMRAVTDNFNKFGLEKVLFTKSDETSTFGSMINLLHDYSLTLSYITNGQMVPDDICAANADQLVEQMLGGAADE